MSELLRQKQEHLKEFEANWNEHENQLSTSARADIEALEEAQIKQLEEFRGQFEQKLDKTFHLRPSASLLQHKMQFEQLIKSKKYSEAHQLREEFQHMEVQEANRYQEERQKKLIKAE